jgi:HSP20 family molecular chaperone IbpA
MNADHDQTRSALPAQPSPVSRPEPVSPDPRHVYTPVLDIYETENGLVLEADLPGVRPEDLQIRVQDNVLHLYGKVTWPLPAQARLLHEEVRPEDFYRSFILSEEVDTENITADFSDGVLQLTLPKAAKAKPRKIEVRTGKNPSQ